MTDSEDPGSTGVKRAYAIMLDSISEPSRRVGIADIGNFNQSGGYRAWLEIRRGRDGVQFEGAVNDKHGGGANAWFADGHGSFVDYETLQQPEKVSWNRTGWNHLGPR